MTFWCLFIHLLPRRPKPALIALYWHLTRRRVRARNRLLAGTVDWPFAYDLWIKKVERKSRNEAELRAVIETWTFRPRFSILVYSPPGASSVQQKRSIGSVERQIYPNWELVLQESPELSSSVGAAAGDFLVLLRSGDVLSDAALFRFAEVLQSIDAPAILYGDEDQIDRRFKRNRPWFKPKWNEEMFLAQDYLSKAVAIERDLAKQTAKELGEASNDVSAFMLTATALANGQIIHVPHIVSHVAEQASRPDQNTRLAAVANRIAPLGGRCVPGPFGTVKVEWPLPEKSPVVSIIVPTRDRLDLLQPCLDSILAKTDYENFEILVLDNESVEKGTADFLARITDCPKVQVLRVPGAYNFSRLNNLAARQVSGSYLCLLNNDTQIVEPAWLTEMMRYAVQPIVGAVGAKLLYGDGSIQHAGVIVGIGGAAGHAHRFLPANKPGYFRQPHVSQFISAVTAACLVVERRKFLAVGGLDETWLPVAYNDVDLCLKLQAAGLRNVYVPHAVLLHHESKSRGADISKQNIARFRKEERVIQDRWGTETYVDPSHNPNLDRGTETFTIRF